MVEKPEHCGSSVHANLARCEDSWVTPHACFIAMGDTPLVHADAYRTRFEQGVSDDELSAIRRHLQKERCLCKQRFQVMAAKTIGWPVSLRRPGRPRRANTQPEEI